MANLIPLPSSFRDNDGFVMQHEGKIYRIVRPSYSLHYERLIQSGLYQDLTTEGRLISHKEVDINTVLKSDNNSLKLLLPEQIPFISYPYEWSFDMWRDAAIVTLKIALVALEKEMVLKDATPFNIQFFKGRPVFIDTLSFEKYEEGDYWIAYHQFCECFLGPLLLMHYGHRDLGKLCIIYPDGIPLEIIKSMLPLKASLNLQVYLHIWLQAKMSNKAGNNKSEKKYFSKHKFRTLLDGLLNLVNKLSQKKIKSVWDDYYTGTILGDDYLENKKKLAAKFVEGITVETLIDLGANDGYFSFLLKNKASNVIAIDADSNCINELYKKIRKEKIKNIVPIACTLTAPSPSIGWNNEERVSLSNRLKGDLVLALALVHHLAIGHNIPLDFIAKWLREMGQYLVIEFVPKSDKKVIQLLQNREDIFDDYSLESFKNCFTSLYTIVMEEQIGNTDRVLFLMKRN